ncbi:MAG: hypothetical protein KF787_12035 [Phycisphaeraceae bacterium]|nr:hypothetical protein [Phycisphaerae bacterium]MBX3393365.1 hypothetical protein [Phycisphaeraceae bacterium]
MSKLQRSADPLERGLARMELLQAVSAHFKRFFLIYEEDWPRVFACIEAGLAKVAP